MKLQDFDFRIWDNERKFFLEKQKINTTADDKIIAAGILRFLGKDSYLGFGEVWEHKHQKDKEQVIIGFNFGDKTTQNLEIEIWTGIKDKNGNKVFEGDIIAMRQEYFDKATQEYSEYGEYGKKVNIAQYLIVAFGEYGYPETGCDTVGFYLLDDKGRFGEEWDTEWLFGVYDRYVVIGNIHENADLLPNFKR